MKNRNAVISYKFGELSIYIKGVYYFPHDIKESNVRENRPYEVQGVFYSGKWYQDTFYITSDFKNLLYQYKQNNKRWTQ